MDSRWACVLAGIVLCGCQSSNVEADPQPEALVVIPEHSIWPDNGVFEQWTHWFDEFSPSDSNRAALKADVPPGDAFASEVRLNGSAVPLEVACIVTP